MAAFVVVVKKYTDHPGNRSKRSAIHRGIDGYNGFLLTDRAAVDRATREGAIRLTDSVRQSSGVSTVSL